MKRSIKSLTAAVLVLCLIFGFRIPGVDALKCTPPGPLTEEMDNSTLVFKGTLISETSDTWTFKVSTWWKGGHAKSTVTLHSNMWTYFEPGEEYIVFAGQQNGKLRPHLCGSTGLSENVDIRPLGPGIRVTKPLKERSPALEATALGSMIATVMSLIGVVRSKLL